MLTVLTYLKNLSAPSLTLISLQIRDKSYNGINPDWYTTIFSGSAPLLRTVHLCGVAFSNCQFPPAEIVELKVDAREISSSFVHPKVFTYMPNLTVLDIRGSCLWSEWDMGSDLVVLPMLERLTWGCLCVEPLFVSIITPTLRYLCLTQSVRDDIYIEPDHGLHDFANAITGSPYTPILPNLDELRYDMESDYAAGCIFVALPRVTLVQFPANFETWELCRNFFKALMDDSSRWPHLSTITFKSFPDQLFEVLRDFVLARSSEDHRFTIRFERDRVIYDRIIYPPDTVALSAEHMVWLRQHVNVKMVPHGRD